VEKSFVAGADISEFSQFSVEEGAQLAAQGQEILQFCGKLKNPSYCSRKRICIRRWFRVSNVMPHQSSLMLKWDFRVSLGVIPGYEHNAYRN
jgi:enoyl-CoA hydratase